MSYASNCPVSRPKYVGARVDDDLGGGVAWNNQMGLFYPVENEMLPLRPPVDMSRHPLFY